MIKYGRLTRTDKLLDVTKIFWTLKQCLHESYLETGSYLQEQENMKILLKSGLFLMYLLNPNLNIAYLRWCLGVEDKL